MHTVKRGYSRDTDVTGRRFWLIAAVVDDEMALELAEFPGESYSEFGGQPFADRPYVARSRTRTLVTQRVGLDV